MRDKKLIIRTRSRRRSYGKKLAERLGQKQRAMESARVREVKAVEPVQEAKPIENVNSTDTKTPTPRKNTLACPEKRTRPWHLCLSNNRQRCYGVYYTSVMRSCSCYNGQCLGTLLFTIPNNIYNRVHSEYKKSRGGW